ncbi:MAG: thiolase domain-containing protein [Nitrososphaeria archaeon]|nr:thiolase domain-containing protein [Aigarchaeota archaeon]MCX8187443.1 thiolase domain-containing protein [Nitrososphaeria archaeon]MDW8021097.1 thiolase domain-containing protein [Nitrososphaerota archaeon]
MTKVFVAGVGFTKIAEHWDRGLDELMAEAALKALEDAGISSVNAIYVGNMLGEALQEQAHLGTLLAEDLGLVGVPAFRVEAAEASGAAAIYQGALDIASGKSETVLVVGGEKLSDGLGEEVSSALMMSGHQEYEGFIGADFYALNALLYRLYDKRYGAGGVAMFPVISHDHAVGVPHAQYPFKLTLEKVLSSPFIAEPLRRMEVSGIGDGAAAVVLIGERSAEKIKSPKTMLHISSSSDYITPFERENPLHFRALTMAVENVIREAKVERREINFIELHDASSIMAAISLESSGFAAPGEAGRLAEKGEFSLGGRIPCNTFGGLKARGHPVGATALYQVAEAHLQLTGRAGKNQVDSAKIGLVQSLGGVAATAFAILLRGV